MVQYLEAQLKSAQVLQIVECKICETTLESVMSQRDLGVMVTNTLSIGACIMVNFARRPTMLFISLKDHFPSYPKKKTTVYFSCSLIPLLLFTSLETSICQTSHA